MNQQIIIPWRDIEDPWRNKHFDTLVEHYSNDFNIVLGDNDGNFNRSAARNKGVLDSTSEISVIIDADNFIPLKQIHDAINAASIEDVLVKPFSLFGYLTEESTKLFYEYWNGSVMGFSPTYENSPVSDFTGGAYVIRRSLWNDIGGMDEGFIGWGAEDDAFHLLCKAMNIKVKYIDGVDYHLYHHSNDRMTSEFNYKKLMKEYVHNSSMRWRLGK